MKTDRELLELAARAAGIEGEYAESKCSCGQGKLCERYYFGISTKSGIWNPLTGDGDALRLAASLQITIDYYELGGLVICKGNPDPWIDEQLYPQGREAATRRAIVRAAAAIGEGMK